MKIYITAKPNSKENAVEKIDETHFSVRVKEPPTENKANKAIVKAVADFLGVSASNVEIVSGHTSKHKVLEIF